MPAPADGLEVDVAQSRPIPLAARLACARGEVLALVGPSGSGKSTILRTIAGVYAPERGRIDAGGRTWLDTAAGVRLPARERRVGFVFQHYALFPHLTAEENVLQALSHVPAGERRARARSLLERTHLAGLEARRPAQLSGGQQQRVAVARALARDPAVLLLDEPFSAVDQATREKLYEELASLRRGLNIPMVLVTHALAEAAMLSDRMSILHRGTTLQAGAPHEVMTRPANPLVARLVGLKNIFTAEVVDHDAGRGVTRIRWHSHVLEARRSLRPGRAPRGACRRRTSCCTGATGRRAASTRTRSPGPSSAASRSARRRRWRSRPPRASGPSSTSRCRRTRRGATASSPVWRRPSRSSPTAST
jgi:molybdate transport system ATP-binding protein